jgi:hypothetical protein
VASAFNNNVNCSICGKEVPLHDCKTDEQGRAVHEECYARRIKQQPPRPNTDSGSGMEALRLMEKPLDSAIIDLFNTTAKQASIGRSHCTCGALMEWRTLTFFYGEKSWEVSLPFCPECNPVSNTPPHHA